jgi:protein gp37
VAYSAIEWTEMTWNPTTGCTKVSAGCKFCYAEAMTRRLQAMGSPKYRSGFEVALHPDELHVPHRWRKPRVVFVGSMSDIFHRDVPEAFIGQVFQTMADCPRHSFQVLTKRATRLKRISSLLNWTENVWMGVSVEDRTQISRIEHLKRCGAGNRFLSLEPLLGPLPALPLDGIDWVIVGGESGARSRPMAAEWVHDIRDQCEAASVPFFFKQWGGSNKKKAGRLLSGRIHDGLPSVLRAA